MKKFDVVQTILADRQHAFPRNTTAKTYAPSNIALCKYWGKRNQELNLPVTSSLSVSLADKGTWTEMSVANETHDTVFVNDQLLDWASPFGTRMREFLNLFRAEKKLHLNIKIYTNIPIGAGLASSACGFASLVQALDALFGWELSPHELSILARIGSGSASRSIWQGFVEWQAGTRDDGMDSYAQPLQEKWPELCIGLLIFSGSQKSVSSREAMQRTVATSPLYAAWPTKVAADLAEIKKAIQAKDFELLGKTAEWNALTMHATMLSAWPAVNYALPETILAMKKIAELRQQGLSVFFTQDAGSNLKLIFLEQHRAAVQAHFPEMEVIQPFAMNTKKFAPVVE